MIWKKTVFSYILWGVYTVLALGGLYAGAVRLCAGTSYPMLGGMAACCAVLLLGGLASWTAYLLGKRGMPGRRLKEGRRRLLEGAVLLAVLAAGCVLRLGRFADGVSANEFFTYAMVEADRTIPFFPHRLVSVYLYLLHFVFLVFGNKLAAGIWLQMLLQGAGLLLVYAAVRKLSGVVPALAMFFLAETSPYLADRALELSPGSVLLFLLGGTLCLTAALAAGAGRRIGLGTAAGLAVGMLLYLDPVGWAALLVLTTALWKKREGTADSAGRRIAVFLLCLAAAAVGFFLLLDLDAGQRGIGLTASLSAWRELFFGGVRFSPGSVQGCGRWDALPLMLGSVGIFSFWCCRERESVSIWVPFALFLAAVSCLGILPAESDPGLWILLSAQILTGISLGQLCGCLRKRPAESALTAEPKPSAAGEPGRVVTVTVRGETRQVKLLDNPLPLPRRHEHKVMDYDSRTEGAYDGYDYPVAEEDDFDL